MANILVTGGAGYIGSHTCKQLAASGHTPIVYDDLSNGHRDAVRWGPFEAGNVADGERLRQVIRAHKPQAVIHFAGLIEVGASVVDPAAFYDVNVNGGLTLLRTLVEEGIRSIVFSSTAAVYGRPDSIPIPEDAPTAPINPYGETKRTVEAMLGYFAAAHGLNYAALRYFNAAGADPDGDLGERHDPESHLIPLVLFTALGQRPHIEIYGTDYPTPDGTAVRACERSCEGPRRGARLYGVDSRTPDRQSRHRSGLFGTPSRRHLPAYHRTRHCRARRAAAQRRSAGVGGNGRARSRPAWLARANVRSRYHSRYRVGVASDTIRRMLSHGAVRYVLRKFRSLPQRTAQVKRPVA